MSSANASESAEAFPPANRAAIVHMKPMRYRAESAMFAVIFLVEPKTERWGDYLDLAKFLKPKLEAVDGFIDNERFASLRTHGRLLSLSSWRDEKAVVRWRIQSEHHRVQQKGRFEIFADYRLRVGEITSDTKPPAGMTIAESRLDATEIGDAKVATITEVTQQPGTDGTATALPGRLALGDQADGLLDVEAFESIYSPGKLLLLGLWRDADTANAWKPVCAGPLRHRQVRILRDYGMFDRREAPQCFGAAEPARHPTGE
jgi:heme-degrading monooxygenase HmoA